MTLRTLTLKRKHNILGRYAVTRRDWDLLFLQARNATSKVALVEVIGEMVSLVEGIVIVLVVAGLRKICIMEERSTGLDESLKDRVGTLSSEAVKALHFLGAKGGPADRDEPWGPRGGP
jgi:hypothetical protein